MSNQFRDGFVDAPVNNASDDLLGISYYTQALADFIMSCSTPLTISIQGEWGSGKTSIMKMVDSSLDDTMMPIWFNTWQYSIFATNEGMALSFLSHLVTSLKMDDDDDSKKALKNTLRIIKGGGLTAIDSFVGGRAAGLVENGLDALAGKKTSDTIDEITSLKRQFQDYITATLKKYSKKRIVFFIDDLDRLNAIQAVEILETLKIFLDCSDCVFVLALDYSVVVSGVERKYGAGIDGTKGKSFFDKIVQLPFKVPTVEYDISKYLKQGFEKININCTEEELEDYKKIVKLSIGHNPRSIKRLFNSLMLMQMIYNAGNRASSLPIREMFVIMCLQQEYDYIYDYFVSNHNRLTYEVFSEALQANSLLKNFLLIEKKLSNSQVERVESFLKVFLQIFHDNNAFEKAENILSMTNMVNVSGVTKTREHSLLSDESLTEEADAIEMTDTIENYLNGILEKYEHKRDDDGNGYFSYILVQDNNETIILRLSYEELGIIIEICDQGICNKLKQKYTNLFFREETHLVLKQKSWNIEKDNILSFIGNYCCELCKKLH